MVKRDEKGRILPEGEKPKSKMITMRVTSKRFEELKIFCKKQGITMADLVNTGIDIYIEKVHNLTHQKTKPSQLQPFEDTEVNSQ